MTGETKEEVSGWTIDTLAAHQRALRDADLRFDVERDRRYTEVAIEREKALGIKESADTNALRLAREIQTYKDEKANELREQISAERGLYATHTDMDAAIAKVEATLKPLVAYIAQQQGRSGGLQAGWAWLIAAVGASTAIAGITIAVLKS